jgi:hypothetical protein
LPRARGWIGGQHLAQVAIVEGADRVAARIPVLVLQVSGMGRAEGEQVGDQHPAAAAAAARDHRGFVEALLAERAHVGQSFPRGVIEMSPSAIASAI